MPAFVFDIALDVIAPIRARAGQVLVVRGEQVAVTRRGESKALWAGTLTPSTVVALVSQGVVTRRARVPVERAG